MRNLICIVCPKGCHLTIDENNPTVEGVTGNSCKRGALYAFNEVANPTRMITSTVSVEDGNLERLPVVTSSPIPKDKIFECMAEINKVKVKAPINIKDVIIPNILGLGVDIVASRNIFKIK